MKYVFFLLLNTVARLIYIIYKKYKKIKFVKSKTTKIKMKKKKNFVKKQFMHVSCKKNSA